MSVKSKYAEAISLFEEGRYAQALAIFVKLENYRDSRQYADKCRDAAAAQPPSVPKQTVRSAEDIYTRAVGLFERGAYFTARDLFISLSGYQQSVHYAEECEKNLQSARDAHTVNVNKAKALREKRRKRAEAKARRAPARARMRIVIPALLLVAALAAAGIFLLRLEKEKKEIRALISEQRYEEAIARADTVQWKKTGAALKIEAAHAGAQAYIAEDRYEDAADLLKRYGTVEDVPRIKEYRNEAAYREAAALYEAQRYEEALAAFIALGKYKDSADQVTCCREAIHKRDYEKAKALLDKEDYEGAIALFEQLDGYEDSADQITCCREAINAREYEKAKALLDEGDYPGAAAIFNTLTGYKDVDDLIAADEKLAEAVKQDKRWSIGNYVTFGTYYSEAYNEKNRGSILWRVLDRAGTKALLISEYGLETKSYHSRKGKEATWETCDLRSWLNGTFLRIAFTEQEQKAILLTDVDNSEISGNSDGGPDSGHNTQDKVFLLSCAEVERYFTSKNARLCHPTSRALKMLSKYGIQSTSSPFARYTCNWWLRSPDTKSHEYARCVYADGGYISCMVSMRDVAAVRPAIWVDIPLVPPR